MTVRGAYQPAAGALQTVQIMSASTAVDQRGRTLSLDFSSSASSAPPAKPKYRTTAERRASHNAVERERRDQLNMRLADLAALLPNLEHVRRPSKARIVNSSIAHAECGSLRREVNGWREFRGVGALIAPPHRGAVFAALLAGELEFEPAGSGDEDGEEEHGAWAAQDPAWHNAGVFQPEHTPPGSEFRSPFAYDIPPPRSVHSERAWRGDSTCPPHCAYAARPVSAPHPQDTDLLIMGPYDSQGYHQPRHGPQTHPAADTAGWHISQPSVL
ncbi:hypothetical protein FB451DRAFT_1396029 [Mycena latifolia]|nr:hypothetical protein FB451DRAFT_1396029 [Mycena latifolia]